MKRNLNYIYLDLTVNDRFEMSDFLNIAVPIVRRQNIFAYIEMTIIDVQCYHL